jgi:ribulose-5-phosphate 4-epimerase/fuculose-1-phosphate aldolase
MNKVMAKYKKQIDDIIEVCHRDGELGYGPSVSGNVSYRVEDNVVLITPTKTPKRKMKPEYICAVDLDGNIIYAPDDKKPTGEMFMHLYILRRRPEVVAVMHAHPPVTIGLSASENGKTAMTLPLIPEVMMQLGPVITVPYAEPNTKALAYQFDPYVNDSNGFILESHGVVVCSKKSVLEVIELIQIMESMALSVTAAMVMDKRLNTLGDKDIDGIDKTIKALGWELPGAPGRYSCIKEIFNANKR